MASVCIYGKILKTFWRHGFVSFCGTWRVGTEGRRVNINHESYSLRAQKTMKHLFLGLFATACIAAAAQTTDSIPHRAIILSGNPDNPDHRANIATMYSRRESRFRRSGVAARFLFLDKKGKGGTGYRRIPQGCGHVRLQRRNRQQSVCHQHDTCSIRSGAAQPLRGNLPTIPPFS